MKLFSGTRHLHSCSISLSALLLVMITIGSASIGSASAAPSGTNTFTVVNDGFNNWLMNGQPDPAIELTRGQTYVFDLQSVPANHPFFIKTVSGTGSGNQFNSGVTGNGATVDGDVSFTVPVNAPAQLFYNCSNHSAMAGVFTIVNELPLFASVFEDCLC